MSATKPDIKVEVHFLSTKEGGRQGPTRPDFHRCPLKYQGEFFDCQLMLHDSGPIAPGETRIVPVVFVSPELIKNRLRVGDTFELWEIGKKAEGTILEIVP